MSGWVEYQRMPENTMHIAYVNEAGEVYLPEYGWKRAGSSALLENATPLIRMDAAEVGGARRAGAQGQRDRGAGGRVRERLDPFLAVRPLRGGLHLLRRPCGQPPRGGLP